VILDCAFAWRALATCSGAIAPRSATSRNDRRDGRGTEADRQLGDLPARRGDRRESGGGRVPPLGAYLRIVGAPPATPTGAPPKVGALGKVGALEGPEIVVFRQVGTAFVVPTDGQLYVPTDGAVTVPYPAVPVAWASAAVLESAMAAASAIVASFMAVFFLVVFREKCGESIDRIQRTFSSRLFNLARLAGSFLPFTGIEPKPRAKKIGERLCPCWRARRATADVGLTKIIIEFESPPPK
jgi:hypothetical protein